MSIAENVARVRERIDSAARRAGRNPDDITLMGVSKTFPAERIREAYAAGLRVFGENRVQEFATKAAEARTLQHARFHLIGHLQSNKSSKAVELFDAVSFPPASHVSVAVLTSGSEPGPLSVTV